ncbi:putative E3 ubiquitin-protein ligase UBR7 [Tetranychus urticae]|uniref:UBR-type domain-containing protein n=1 Tax=Tetranychus urticae TaxID=32264 RepID=T1KB06_TETUR|nr:putative E3 ubiquitin-protein ligase UBR7 [Tetranychus urticae]
MSESEVKSLEPVSSSLDATGVVKKEEAIDDLQDPEAAGDEDCENVITMMDVLEEEKQLEDDAFAVLGGSDEKDCTYLRGYVVRQALYACNTCKPSAGEPNGICLACTYACHEGHDLYELYTKRSFRCDCGNSKMAGSKCNLCPTKSATNPDNKYNHNFSGLYCTCNRPYPDPDNDDAMYQCIVCEDWFHDKHLESEIPEEKGFAEMVCSPCMTKLDFLWYYYKDTLKSSEDNAQINQKQQASSQADQKPIVSSAQEPSSSENNIAPNPSTSSATSSQTEETESDSKSSNADNIDSGIESSCDSIVSPSSTNCKLESLQSSITIDTLKGATFWEEGWRSNLCKCTACLKKYSSLGCAFICDETDTVSFYEKQGKEKSIQISQYERGLNEINKMDRVSTIEAIQECNFMAEELKTYLKKFADNKKVVRREDIDDFFEGLKARKRSRYDVGY